MGGNSAPPFLNEHSLCVLSVKSTVCEDKNLEDFGIWKILVLPCLGFPFKCGATHA